jgi:virulence factor Mce-like protein
MATRRRGTLALVLTACLSASGCASEGLASLPLPAPGSSVGGGGLTLTAEFANALNLPHRAKVKLGGADIGEVTSMVARNYTALVTVRVQDGIALPKGTTAELRSATPLADVFLALKPPSPAVPNAPLLKNGDKIGIESTASAATVEALLSAMGVVVNGGSIRNLTNLINGIGKAAGDQGDAFGNLIRKTNHTLGTLNARSEQISTALTETGRLSSQLKGENEAISELLTEAGPATDALNANATQIADLVDQVSAVTRVLSRFPSIGGNDTSGRSVIKDLNTLSSNFNDIVLDPNATLYKLNMIMPPLVKMFSGSGWSVKASIDRLILGSIPDVGFAGDPGLHGPKWYNLNQLFGSLRYTLLRLQERVYGKGPRVPEVPVIPSPTEPGELQVVGPAPGPPCPPSPIPGPLGRPAECAPGTAPGQAPAPELGAPR